MSLETADRVGDWIERELDRVRPEKFVLTFFGGEPLLNLPVMYALAERLWQRHPGARRAAGRSASSPTACCSPRRSSTACCRYGLRGREDHARRRSRHAQPDAAAARRPGHLRSHHREHPPRRRHASRIAIGGNFDEISVDSYPALLEFLKQQEFADKLVKVNFKPIVRNGDAGRRSRAARRRASCR